MENTNKKIDEKVVETGTTPEQTQTADLENDYLEAIKELKANSVDRKEYLKLKEENKKLLKEVVSGEISPNRVESASGPSIEDLKKKLTKTTTNLDYIKTMLDIRDLRLEETKGKEDIFLATGHNTMPTADEIANADFTARKLRELVDEADGDPNRFIALYNSNVQDSSIGRRGNVTAGGRVVNN